MSALPHTPFFVLAFTLIALRPPMPRHSTPFNLQFALGWLINEQPFLGLWWLFAGTVTVLSDPYSRSPAWWLVVGLTALDVLFLSRLALRARSARPALATALERAFGAGAAPRATRPSWWRLVLVPFVAWRPDVRRLRNRRYGSMGRAHRLDVYVSRRRRGTDAPVLVYVHGGGFVMGSKMLGARPLLYRLAARGWVCVSVNYRLFRASYADQLADVRDAMGWTRANVAALGGSPDRLFIAGASSGAHLGATAALSDSNVTGVIAMYGYYGEVGSNGPMPASPLTRLHTSAPPFLVVHGGLDTLVLAEDARVFTQRLRTLSSSPVAYAELPGAQHNFDFFHSLRAHAVVDAVIRFAELTSAGDQDRRSERPSWN
jgi:acetyl esterase/lipase